MMKHWFFLLALSFAASALASKPLPPLGEGNTKLEALAKKKQSQEVLSKQEQDTWDEFQQDLFNYDLYRDNIWPFCGEDATDVAPACSSVSAEERLYADDDQGQVKMYYRFPAAERTRTEHLLDELVKKWSAK